MLEFSEGTLLLKGWQQSAIAQVFGDDLWRRDSRVNAWRCEAAKYSDVLTRWQAAQATLHLKLSLEDRSRAWPTTQWPKIDLPALRDEQQ